MSTIGKWVSLSCDWSDFQPNRKPSARTRNPYKQSLILIIDDDPTERLMARDALERADYRVIEAEDGPDGLAKAHTCSIPDDHIDPRRSALFMARSVLRDIRDGGANACSTS